MESLPDRQQTVLRLIVSEYIASAVPVASAAIVQKYTPAVSPATIRNAMFQLEQSGFVYQPHTSAGRVPSDQGYRYFVDRLLDEPDLEMAEKRSIQERVESQGLSIEEVVRLSAYVLAQAVGNATIVSMPFSPQCRIKHIEVVSVDEQTVLLVVLLLGGNLRQQVISLAERVPDSDLSTMSHRLTDLFRGLSARQLMHKHLEVSGVEKEVREVVLKIMQQVDANTFNDFYYEGLPQILNQPEFSRSEKLRSVLETLQQQAARELALLAVSRQGTLVQIGSEIEWPTLQECSLVFARYGREGEAVGLVGTIGPTRMRYDRAISSVRFVGRLLGQLVHKFC
ncbi:MAG: heat-inducible transcriptional repressor HrcA [Bacteroidetes bacterium]|nr:heat-inducible transcriptional repressor HrcA [Bacteroidota bacterium]MCL5027117.1 heat-inducible transcriptional repressor HrcA [Chloroflexota bacterium]